MPNLNKVLLMGNVTRDFELKYTPKGTAVVELGLAVSRRVKGDNDEWRDETTFIDVTLWGRQAEIAKEYLTKGKPVFIEGRLQLDTWDDKQTGQKRSKLRVTGENMQLIGARGEGGGGGGGSSSSSEEYDQRPTSRPQSSPSGGQQRPKPKPAPAPADDDDDIPF